MKKIGVVAWRRTFHYLILCQFFVASNSTAQTFTFEEVLKTALKQNQELQAAKFSVVQAQARAKDAGLLTNPEIEFERESKSKFVTGRDRSDTVAFKQKFPISGRLADEKAIARVDIAMAIAEIKNQKRLLIAQVSSKLRELVVVDKKLEINQLLRKGVEELIAVSEKKLQVAEVSAAEVNLQKLELQRSETEQIFLQSTKLQIISEINGLLGRFATEPFVLDDDLISLKNLAVVSVDKKEVLNRRPDRQLALLKVDRAASEIKLARATRWDDWTVGLEYTRETGEREGGVGNPSSDNIFGVNLTVPLPLWNQGQGKIASAAANRSQMTAQLRMLELQIENEIDSSQQKIKQLLPYLEQYNNSSLRLAHDNQKLLLESYRQGLVGLGSVIQAQQQLADIRQGYAGLLEELLRAVTDFEAATAASPLLEEEL